MSGKVRYGPLASGFKPVVGVPEGSVRSIVSRYLRSRLGLAVFETVALSSGVKVISMRWIRFW